MSLNFGIFALHCGMMALFTTLPFIMVDLGLDKTVHWKIYFPATLLGLILMVPAIIIGETRNRLKQVFISGIVLTLIALAALMLSLHSLWLIAACLIVYFIGFNILEASQPSMVSKIAPADLKGTPALRRAGRRNALPKLRHVCRPLVYTRIDRRLASQRHPQPRAETG